MQALVVGDPLEKGPQVGPVVDAGQLDQDHRYLDRQDEGAELSAASG